MHQGPSKEIHVTAEQTGDRLRVVEKCSEQGTENINFSLFFSIFVIIISLECSIRNLGICCCISFKTTHTSRHTSLSNCTSQTVKFLTTMFSPQLPTASKPNLNKPTSQSPTKAGSFREGGEQLLQKNENF